MIRRPPRSTLVERRRQRQMCIRDRVEGCDITFLADGFSRAQRASLLQPGVRRGSIPGPDVWLARCRGTRVQVASPALATMQALKLVRRGTSRWPVVSAPGKDDAFTRAVQLIDATRRHLHVDPTKVLAAGQQHIDMLWLLSLIHISEPTRRTERSRMPSSA